MKKVTISDISGELGLSKNTISKALNNHPNVPEATKKRIIDKAVEMNYKGYSHLENTEEKSITSKKNIILLTNGKACGLSFFSKVLQGVEEEVSKHGRHLIVTIIKDHDIKDLTLPPNINTDTIDGIICIEIFNTDYIRTILKADIPTVFIDFSTVEIIDFTNYDILLMENFQNCYNITNQFIKKGIKNIGFVGDIFHCRSFHERWSGYVCAMTEANLLANQSFNITVDDEYPYGDSEWLADQMKMHEQIPQAFICANDSIAISTMIALKKLGYNIPNDVQVVGFDNIAEGEIISPQLTTIHTCKHELGVRAVNLLFSRINTPTHLQEKVYMKTQILFRNSTNL